MEDKIFNLEFGLHYEKNYCGYRQSYYAKLHFWFTVLGLVLMWASAASLAVDSVALSLALSVFGGISIIATTVGDFQKKRDRYERMIKELSDIQSEYDKVKHKATVADIDAFESRKDSVMSCETHYMRAVQECAYNEALVSFDRDPDWKFNVGKFRRLTANMIDWRTPCEQVRDIVQKNGSSFG